MARSFGPGAYIAPGLLCQSCRAKRVDNLSSVSILTLPCDRKVAVDTPAPIDGGRPDGVPIGLRQQFHEPFRDLLERLRDSRLRRRLDHGRSRVTPLADRRIEGELTQKWCP